MRILIFSFRFQLQDYERYDLPHDIYRCLTVPHEGFTEAEDTQKPEILKARDTQKLAILRSGGLREYDSPPI